jgi:hypothetical protein
MGVMGAVIERVGKPGLRPLGTGLATLTCALALAVALACLYAPTSRASDHAIAREAKKIQLSESAQLKFTREDGSALVEYGQAAGTYNAPVSANLTIHPTSVTATVTIYPKGGSITGTAQANYIVKGSVGYFGGNFTITHGTGTYRRVSGKALGISGTINRETFAMTVKAHGEISQ